MDVGSIKCGDMHYHLSHEIQIGRPNVHYDIGWYVQYLLPQYNRMLC